MLSGRGALIRGLRLALFSARRKWRLIDQKPDSRETDSLGNSRDLCAYPEPNSLSDWYPSCDWQVIFIASRR